MTGKKTKKNQSVTKKQSNKLKNVQTLDSVVIRFAGDSGDGIQTTGTQFTNESALAGNDLVTLPDFPSEIRPPAGSIAGVSAFQIKLGSYEVHTVGDQLDVLVAFNPAALRANVEDVKRGGIIILNEDTFVLPYLEKVEYEINPCTDDIFLANYQVLRIPLTQLTRKALSKVDLPKKSIDRCKNLFALGITLQMFNRPTEGTLGWIQTKFAKKPEIIKANTLALKSGIKYAKKNTLLDVSYIIKPAELKKGTYRNISGTMGVVFGLISAAQKSKLHLFYGAYPITPASDILHELAKYKDLDITTFQAEDEIAAICSAIGSAFAGHLAVTGSSGPGIALKLEALGLAVMTELPLVIINVQRAGPSTGMPTKSEQSDLFQALYGRHGEAPLCVLAAYSPHTCFKMTYEACRIATKYMTPVIVLTEGYVSNTLGPWRIPDPDDLKDFELHVTEKNNNPGGKFLPFLRDQETGARPWVKAGIPELMHRIGGLEKEVDTGNVCYQPENHSLMCKAREEKIARITAEMKPLKVKGERQGELLVVGWGSTKGAIEEAVFACQAEGLSVSSTHTMYLNPLPPDLGDIIKGFNQILVPENNSGQFLLILRARYLVDAKGLSNVTGQPLRVATVKQEIYRILGKK